MFAYFLFTVGGGPKEPATVEQVTEVLASQGYIPQDITERYYKQDPDFKRNLIKCIAMQKDDIHFEFFTFTNRNGAINIYGQAHALLFQKKIGTSYVEHKTSVENYRIYTLKVDGTYNVAIYVENTAVYAYCDEENAGAISDILAEIGYFEKTERNDATEKQDSGKTAAIVMVFLYLILHIVHKACLNWLWDEVLKIAGVSKWEIREYQRENRGGSHPKNKFYVWLLNKSQEPKRFKRFFWVYQICILPSILCLSFSVLGCFTHAFDEFLGSMGVVMSGLPVVFAICGVLYNVSKRKSY